jgi:hypothetical protein
MRTFRTTSEVTMACVASDVYEFVVTPKNWVGTHPVTRAVRGETESPRGLGDRWSEVIQGKESQFEVEWQVTRAEPYSLWEIRANNFGGLPAIVTITYFLRPYPANMTAFRREMVTEFPDDFPVTDFLADAFTSSETHDRYLKAVKERLEKSGG